MSAPHNPELVPGDRHATLFASLVLQQSNMALMFLGKIPNPETGQAATDLTSARIFIDQLEMLEVKTKGNLSPGESQMLKDALTTLRMAFVEMANAEKPAPAPAPAAQPSDAAPSAGTPASSPAPAAFSSPEPASGVQADPEAESKKKFSKKY